MQFGVIGLATMGANLARNAARNGAEVILYNRSPEKTDELMENYSSEGSFVPTKSLEEFCGAFSGRKVIMLMVKAGSPVDAVITDLKPLLSKGDILIDGGNTEFTNTERRIEELEGTGVLYIGTGVSGGEEGALIGPSIMPGGSKEAFDEVADLLSAMSADDGAGGKCMAYIGPGGAGNFVKTVHNGIEYGIMQLIAESYDILKRVGGLSNAEIGALFDEWKQTEELGSFLVEITSDTFFKANDLGEGHLIDFIKDTAKQKGTGKWTTQSALDFGVATPTINAAVDARITSGSYDLRQAYQAMPRQLDPDAKAPQDLAKLVEEALGLAVILSYHQGFELIEVASKEKEWGIDLAEVARIWRGGCIVRSRLLPYYQQAYSGDKKEEQAAYDFFQGHMTSDCQVSFRKVIQTAVAHGIAAPCFSISLAYLDALSSERLPQNLVQAQRDYFGHHTYERIDQEGTFHADWAQRDF